MPHVLRLVDHNATLLKDLTAGAWSLHEYTPVSPEEGTTDVTTLADGGERPQAAYRNINEPASFFITAATPALVQAELNDVQRLFMEARDRQRLPIVRPIYLEFQPDGAASAFRSELIGGKYQFNADSLDYQWLNKSVQVTLNWRRRFYWEGAESEIPLANGGGSGTGGRVVYNHDDGGVGHDNYTEIAAADIVGDLPAPVRISIQNTNLGARSSGFLVFHNYRSNPSTLSHILEGESASNLYGGSSQVGAGQSNGFYFQSAVLTTTEVSVADWTLSTALLDACNCGFFMGLLVGANNWTTAFAMRLNLYFELTRVWQGPLVNLPVGVSAVPWGELGSVQLPPFLAGQTGFYPLILRLTGKTLSGTGQITVDYIQLSPLDGFRRYAPSGYDLAQNVILMDDMPNRTIYTSGWATAGKTPHYVGVGHPIMLRPNRVQRLYFLHNTDTGDVDVDRVHTIRAYYRPRRLQV